MNAAPPPDTLSPRTLALACLGLLTGLGTVPAEAQTASAPGTPAAATAASTPSAPASTVRSLIDQARHWQGRQRPDLAAQAWQKLLAVDPRQPDALHGMAVLSTEAGRFDEATSYLNRLRQVRPDHPALATLTRQVQTQTATPSMLTTARQYAQAGQTEAAAQAYRQALGPQPPTDELALEYYQTLGGTRDGWDEARRGLERVAQAQPGQAGPALALAKHLTYRDSTRRDGINRLITLATSADAPPGVRQDARAAWRQALLWMGPRPADVSLYRRYLDSVGDDERVRARLAEATQPSRATASARDGGSRPADPQQAASREGFAQLNANQLDAATERFEAQLKRRPDDAEALAGIGLVRLRQERFDEAVELLGRAAAGSARWKPVHQTALHWQAVHEADGARQAGDIDRATRLARAAVDANPKEPEAQVLLGDLLAGQGLLPGAEAAYRAALRQDARHPRATLGLASVLGAAGRPQQASAFVEQIDADLLGRLGGAGALRAAQMRLQAELALQRGDSAGAQALLQQAVTQAPAAPWVRLSLGQMLVRQGRLDEARAQLDAFVIPKAPAAQRTEALHARASLQAELRDWAGAQQTLEQVPPGERKGEVARLQRRVAVQAQAAEAVALARAGQNAQAQWLLTEAETAAGQDPELLGAVAGARMDLGEEVRAGQMIRATLAAQPQAGPGLRLRLAALLLQTRQDTELAGLLQQLSGQSLTAAQRRDFDDLRVGFALRQSDLLREQGDLYNAWEALGPLLQERPREPRLLMALARLHGSAGDDAQARALYETVLQQRPDDVDAWLGLAGAADAQKDHDTARQALAEAQKLAPNTPQVLAQYARHHRAQGQFSQAAEYLRAAVAAEQPARGVQWGQARATTNPFAAYAGRATAQTTMLAGAIRPRTTPLVRPDAAFVDVENLPPTGAGGRPLTDSPIARAQRWRAPEPAPAPAAPVAGTPRFAAAPAAPVAEAAPLPAAPARTASRRRTLADELAEVQNERGRSHAAIGGTITSRTGEAGLGRADLVQTPIEATKVIEEVGQLTVRATPVVITAGRVGADAGSRSRFGTLGLDPAGSASPAEQSDAGVGLSVGLQTRHVSADIGSTPIGFAVVDAVGGVRWRGELDSALRFDVEASRRALTDSVLAFAGTTDTRTGKVWGGVRSTGLRAQLAWEQGDVGFYGYGGAHGLTGREVKTNSRVEVGAGSYWRGRQRADDQLEIGLNLGYQHYRYNLSGYTWGHGGYFSPQHLVALTLPLNWYGRSGRLSWGLQGAAGLQVYREDAAPYFPTDAAAQGTLDSLVAQQKLPASAYAARSEAGAIFNLGGALEYQLTRQLDIGTRLGVEISPQFTQSTGSIYLRFSLEPRAAGGIGLRYPGGPTGY